MLPISARATPRPKVTGENRVLVLQPDHLGDILLSEPAIRLLRRAIPDSELIAVVGPWSAEITRMSWPVDRVIEVEFPGFTRASAEPNRIGPYSYLFESADRLSRERADDAIVLRDDAWWTAWLARASVGREVVASGDHRVRPFVTIAAQAPASPHRTVIARSIVDAYLARIGLDFDVGVWDVSPKLMPDAFASELLEILPTLIELDQRDPYIVLHPGSGAEVKTWPADRWRAVIRELQDVRFVLTGSDSERALCAEIAENQPNANSIAGLTPLPVLAGILRDATLAVGTDNGPMHLAAAAGAPTVRLFGPSDPARYGPWPGAADQRVISAGWSCPRCGDLSPSRSPGCGCMLAITIEMVVDSIRSALNGGA
ncbi:MAG: glycosyltransferase family 9 protein [Thermomicrobiales bacterium]